jgi:hypothetical protein
MNFRNVFKTCLLVLITGLCSCATQNPGVETDDLYYSAEDRGREIKQKNQEEQKQPKVIETKPAKTEKNNYNFESKP